jgi:hypothetical protein
MATQSPRHLSASRLVARQERIAGIAVALGFVGNVEYRHVYSQTGGAQYARGSTEDDDLLTAYAEAFDRDADPEDFSLEAIIAHERGHQILARHPRIAKLVAGMSLASEEIMASLLGSIICRADIDREMLSAKAAFELVVRGQTSEAADCRLQILRRTLEALL